MRMRPRRRHGCISATFALCALALYAQASVDQHEEVCHVSAGLSAMEGVADKAALFALEPETSHFYEGAAFVQASVNSKLEPLDVALPLPTLQPHGLALEARIDTPTHAALPTSPDTALDNHQPLTMTEQLLDYSVLDRVDSPESAQVEEEQAITAQPYRADLIVVETEKGKRSLAKAAFVPVYSEHFSHEATDLEATVAIRLEAQQQSPLPAETMAKAQHSERQFSKKHQLFSAAAELPALPTGAAPTATSAPAAEEASASPSPAVLPPEHLKRDPKSLKERFNYASSDCAAVVLKANREARGLTSILNSKKDQYMLNECSAQSKFVIVELCDDILVDTLVMGNYEFFSSTFRDTMVYVSDRYPPKENSTWTLLGHFQARNSRDAQVFPVTDPKVWAKYIKVEFLTHYGQEFYCPLTVLKVYGATQMEQYRKEAEEDGGEFMDTATLTVDVLLGTPALDYQMRFPYHKQPSAQLRIGEAALPAKAYLRDMQGLVNGYVAHDEGEPVPAPQAVSMPKVPNLPWGQGNVDGSNNNADEDEDEVEDEDDDEDDEDEDGDEQVAGPGNGSTWEASNEPTLPDRSSPQQQQQQQQPLQKQYPQYQAHLPQQQPPSDGVRERGQESIFKTIMRRLARVERNITLAYHYLEEQHMVFNMVLQQVELNNLENVQLAIKQLNHSTAKQMQSLTALSEEVWRAILYDLEAYQQKTNTELGGLTSKLEFLAEEVLFEKRMNVAQLVLLLTIIVMVAVNKVATKLALIPESKKEK